MSRPRSECPVVDGWVMFDCGDYAEPTSKGGGYVEVQEDGTFEVAYEARDEFLITSVPVEVIRELLRNYDAKQEAGK